jgi:hypothetical protein
MFIEQQNYTTFGERLNIPGGLLIDAGLALGTEITVLAADGMLLVAAVEGDRLPELTDELGCVMSELGYDPELIFSAFDGEGDEDERDIPGEDGDEEA